MNIDPQILAQFLMQKSANSSDGQQSSMLDPIGLAQKLGLKPGPGGLPPLDPIGGMTNKMGIGGAILNPGAALTNKLFGM